MGIEYQASDMCWVIVISLRKRLKNGKGKGGIHAMADLIIWAEGVWTRTMARPLNRLDLPLELSFGAAAIRRRSRLFDT